MKSTFLILIFVSGFAIAAEKPVPLSQMPGIPLDAVEILGLHGVETDREFLLAGQVNPAGVAAALGVAEEGLSRTVSSFWRVTGKDWAQRWASSCSKLVNSGAPSATHQQTPLLALTCLQPVTIRQLVRWNIKTAESFYTAYVLKPELLAQALGVGTEGLAQYVDGIRQGAPHVVSFVTRLKAKESQVAKLNVFLTVRDPASNAPSPQ